MRIVAVSHSAVVDRFRDKFALLANLGCDLHLILPRGWPEGGRWVAAPAPGSSDGLSLHVLPVLGAGSVGHYLLPGLGGLIRRLKPDLVHIEEEPRSLVCWQALRAARSAGCPAIFFTWENMLRRFRPPLRWVLRQTLRRADRAIAGTEAAGSMLRAYGFLGPVDVIPQYGVDPEMFRRRPMPSGSGRREFTIGYFGRLREEKGLATLMRACAWLEFPFRLTITGSGDQEHALKKLARELGLGARIEFAAAVDHSRMPEALSGAEVLVLPSETRADWKEQFGRVLVEAMACEVPVVGSSSGEIPGVIGDAGLIFPEGDPAALAAQLTRLHSDRILAADLARRGRARVLAHFTTASIAARILGVYRQALTGRP